MCLKAQRATGGVRVAFEARGELFEHLNEIIKLPDLFGSRVEPRYNRPYINHAMWLV